MKHLIMGSVLALSSVFTITACTNVGAATNTSASTSAMQQKGDKHDGMRGPFAQLDLSATQQAQIKAIMQSKRDDRQDMRAQHTAERQQVEQQIKALTDSKTLNTTALNRLAEQQATQHKQRFMERVQMQHAIAQVLTPEQRAKMAQLQSERSKHHKKGARGEKGRHGMTHHDKTAMNH